MNIFLDTSTHGENPLQYLKFNIIDGLNNVESLTTDDIDNLLLRKEKMWIGMLLTQHKGMDASHDWKRKTKLFIEICHSDVHHISCSIEVSRGIRKLEPGFFI